MRRFLTVFAVFLALSGSASADTLGESRTFRVNRFYDLTGATSVSATLRAVSNHAYFYVDDRAWSALGPDREGAFVAALQALAAEFDSIIRPRATALWGAEPTPGVDGDPRVTVLLERLIAGNGGYFESINAYPTDVAPESNAREMLAISSDAVLAGTARGFLAHEFHHLLSVARRELMGRVPEDVWLNEARAEYTITAAGQSDVFEGSTLQRRVGGFVRTPSDSLTEWPNTSTDYAIASLFAHYLVDRFGTGILAQSLTSSQAGVAALSEWLLAGGHPRFEDVFADWMLAAAVNDRTLGASYGYVLPALAGFQVAPTHTAALQSGTPLTWNLQLKEYQPVWFHLTLPPGTLPRALTVSATAPGVPVTGAWIAVYEGGVRIGRLAEASIPTVYQGKSLREVLLAAAPVSLAAIGTRTTLGSSTVTVTAALGDSVAAPAIQATPTPSADPVYVSPVNGDLIRRIGQAEVYVVWEGYRRYMPHGVLELYGFQDRPVQVVPDDVFFRLKVSNYIRTQGDRRVYAVRPEGTKHWLNITPGQWDASRRDWGAIFTVNEREAAFYRTGEALRQ